MTSFYVNHGEHDEATALLGSAVQSMGTILDRLNQFLRQMNNAVHGQAAPLWEQQQNKWSGDYDIMVLALDSGHKATVNIGTTFLEGDRRGAQIML